MHYAQAAQADPRSALILQAIDAGPFYGFSMMDMTGLPSGTLYPAMRRMEEDQLGSTTSSLAPAELLWGLPPVGSI
jgi:hypothetical protein